MRIRPGLIACLCLLLPGAVGAQTLDPDQLVSIVIECSDGLDNDRDGRADYPDDPGCVDADDEAERTPTPLRRTRARFRTLRLPRLPKGVEVEASNAWVTGVSGDGRVKVGVLNVRDPRSGACCLSGASVIWVGNRPRIIDDVLSDLGSEAGPYSAALGVSENGRWIVGRRGDWAEIGSRGYRWRGGRLEDLASLSEPGQPSTDFPVAVSNRGVAVGHHDLLAVRWDERGAVALDHADSAFPITMGASITPDGGLTVGAAHFPYDGDPEAGEAVYPTFWTHSDARPVRVPLPDVGGFGGHAWDASDDGRVIVGTTSVHLDVPDPVSGDPIQGVAAFRWTDQGITWMGMPVSVFYRLEETIWSTSGDGSISVGWLAQGRSEPPQGPVVLAGGKLRSLVDLLRNEYGLDVEGWDFSSSRIQVEVSGDGRTLVGNARAPGAPRGSSHATAFEIRLPPACSDGLDNDGDGQVDYTEDGGCRGPGDASEERRREVRRLSRR